MKKTGNGIWLAAFAALTMIGCAPQAPTTPTGSAAGEAPASAPGAAPQSTAAPPSTPAPARTLSQAPAAARTPASAAAPVRQAEAPKPQPRVVTLPEGTVLKVRTTTALSTNTHQSGDAFAATLEEALTDGSRVLAPKGARVEGTVAAADKGGRVKGVAELAVRLTKLTLADGQVVDISTGSVARQASTTKKKDAAKVGIASGVGAAIGAIAGGGRGAAIGAASGAGAGGGLVLATRGEPAVIGSESVLAFKLASPLTVKTK